MHNKYKETASHKIVPILFENTKIEFELHHHTGILWNDFICDNHWSEY